MDSMGRKNPQKVIIAMSGGLDSSVAAALLKREGFETIGVFMKLWSSKNNQNFEKHCCFCEAELRAKKVAKILNIPFYIFDLSQEFKKRVVDYFLKELKKGNTPNPCVVCNKEIKFGLLLEKAFKLGGDFFATGHYARKIQNQKSKFFKLLRAKDKEKDQSYFLWQLNQKQLKKILFPIGNYKREEVKNLAKKFKLPVLKAKKSVEICFIQKTLNDFLKEHLKENAGKIISNKGKILGEHKGLWFYTIGQRKGLGIFGGPWWVLKKDQKKNLLVVTKNEKELFKKELFCKNINWISDNEPKLPLKIKAKIRYKSNLISAIISKINYKKYKVIFAKPQRAITPGQSVVFYKGQELFGGGIIT